jgi:arylsulfatase A-like enzyme
LHGKEGSTAAGGVFYQQWSTSPFAETYLTKLALAAVDSLGLGKSGATDYLGVSYSSVDSVGHAFGPRSREIQDMLVRLDKDLGELFTHLDEKVGRANYVVAFSADHGVVPIPEEMQKTGVDAGVLNLVDLKDRLEKALEPFNYSKPEIARITGRDIYFSQGIYGQLRQDPAAMRAVIDAALTTPGVFAVYRAEDLIGGSKSVIETRTAMELSYFAGRSGDLFVVPKPYWLLDGTALGQTRAYATGHGTPYNYDQHVPIFLMGYGIEPGEYFAPTTPADIAPTLASLTGVTLATRDGRVLSEALRKRAAH